MSRGLCALSLSLALATTLAAGCSGSDATSHTSTDETAVTTVATGGASKITLRGARTNTGPWVGALSLEHGPDGQPTSFYVCAAWDESRPPEGCDAAPGSKLPPGTILRLEQRPVGSAPTTADSPGWGTVGTSELAELHVPLSDFVAGLDVDTATYRVTLRRLEGGAALATSNTFTVTWAR
jgi:hypothetical protein